MPKFSIPLVRTAHRHLTVEVRAKSIEQALDQAGDHEFPGEKEADYSIADHTGEATKKSATTCAAGAFMAGDDPYQEYINLLNASEKGNGDDLAAEHAQVWEPMENYSVDGLIHVIEDHAGAIINLLK